MSTATTRVSVLRGILPLDRRRLPVEALAGLTLAALAIPEVMGYATIAGMPVVTGLYTLLLPMVAYSLLGGSRHLVVGADSATAAVLAAGLAPLAAAGSPRYVALAGLVALMAGVLLVAARLVGLGFLADFLSRSVLVGFLTGVGIKIAAGQVGGVLGIPESSGVTVRGHHYAGTVAALVGTLSHLAEVHWPTVAVSVAVIVVIGGAKRVTTVVPGALVAVVGAIVVSWAGDLASHGVAVIGPVPRGLPSLSLPAVGRSDLTSVLAMVVAVLVLIVAQSAATSRAYAARYDEEFDENTDLVGLAAANLAAGVTGTFVVNGSPTKTEMVDGARGRSQVAQLAAAVVVVVVLVLLTRPLQYLPEAALASVVIVIGVSLVDIGGLRRIWRLRRGEAVVALLTAATVVVAGVEQGVALAIAASLVEHLRRSYRPVTSVISAEDPSGHWHAVPVTPATRTRPGVVVYRFAGSLYYANASHFLDEIRAFVPVRPGDPPLRWLCVDAQAIPDIDYTGELALRQARDFLAAHHVRLAVVEPMHTVRRELEHYGLTELLGADAIFPTIGAALAAFGTR